MADFDPNLAIFTIFEVNLG